VNGFFSIYLILLAALGPGVYSASNRNEYQKQKNNVFVRWSAASMYRADNLTAICDPILDSVGSLTSHNPIGLHGLL
jgi:type II secretory pathway pseudopilin PulG